MSKMWQQEDDEESGDDEDKHHNNERRQNKDLNQPKQTARPKKEKFAEIMKNHDAFPTLENEFADDDDDEELSDGQQQQTEK